MNTGNFFKKIFRLALAAGLLWFAWLGVEIWTYANQTSTEPADAAVVLGAAVYRNRPSPVFRERINHAIRLYQDGQVEAVIFTGGLGSRDQVSEAEAARQHALAAGVPDEAIYIETTSTNTFGNLENAKEIINAQNFDSVLVVSDPLHMRRAMAYADDLALDAEPSPTTTTRYVSFRPKFNFLMREVYFMALYHLFPEQVLRPEIVQAAT